MNKLIEIKYLTPIVICILVLLSCGNDDDVIAPVITEPTLSDFELAKKDICSSLGELPGIPILRREDQLLKIEEIDTYDALTDSFIYDQDDLLIAIDQVRNNRRFEFEYQQDSLVEMLTYKQLPEQQLLYRDSLVYGADGRLLYKYKFSISLAPPSLPLFSIDSFFYDDQGYLIYRSCYWVAQEEYFDHSIYCWEDGNLTHETNFNYEGKLRSEFLETFSSEEDLKVVHRDPRQWVNPVSWSKNKVINSDFIDHAGNIDIICVPCDAEYSYDDKGRLISALGDYWSIFYTYRD